MKRIELLKPYIKGKKVLDVGFVQHNWEKSISNPNWLHDKIRNEAKETIGIDCLEDDVNMLKSKGYNAICADAEEFNLNDKFDIIIAGELIEHLSNPGKFLCSARKHLKKEGKLIITTPNVFAFGNIARIMKLLFNIENIDNPEHVNWYSKQNLFNLAERHGFKVLEYKTFYPDRYNPIFEKLPLRETKSKIFASLSLK
ncbi:MAG: class I SAM-dependent methyltransferase [Parcubacteria group bacterium]|jgi:2-polyprenyl-3-methyl-5-hydroxy-6-metoxy-1,4-benzoquinol methylase